jgi:signal peptidase II
VNKTRIKNIIIISIIIIDQLIKIFMINKKIVVIQNFLECTYTKNTGVAFGLADNNILFIILINIFMLSIMFIIIKKIENEISLCLFVNIIFIFAGGLSNFIDRIFRGYVIDYIDLNILNFPNFNIADFFISIGVIVVILEILKQYITKK